MPERTHELPSGLRPQLVAHARLIRDAGEGAILELPGGERVRLNERAARVLEQCNGVLSAESLVARMGGGSQWREFLGAALERRWLENADDSRH